MQLVRQGSNECVLACVAMLAGVTLDDVRTWVRTELDRDAWFQHSAEEFYRLFRAFGITFGPDERPTHEELCRVPCPVAGIGPGETAFILRFNRANGETEGHAVVYHDETVYDPKHDKPLSLEAWLHEPNHIAVDFHVFPIQPIQS